MTARFPHPLSPYIRRLHSEALYMEHWSIVYGCRFVLEQILRGKIDVFGKPQYFPEALDREDAMQEWLSFFRAKVVDVNRTSRGSPTGGIGRFSAMVVVGNSNVRPFTPLPPQIETCNSSICTTPNLE